jgi:hypothetical protein
MLNSVYFVHIIVTVSMQAAQLRAYASPANSTLAGVRRTSDVQLRNMVLLITSCRNPKPGAPKSVLAKWH